MSSKKHIGFYHENIFFEKSNIIFICYKDDKFKKLEKMKSNKKKVIIDLWNFLNIKQKNIIINKVGLSD